MITTLTISALRQKWIQLMAAALIGISGTLMLTAGISLPLGWAAARPFMLAGGLSVQAAFLIQRRAIDRPHANTRRSLTTQGAASALMLLAGIALVTIGYHAARFGWWPIATTTVIPIAAAILASTLNQRAAAIRLARQAVSTTFTCTPQLSATVSRPTRAHPEPFRI